MVFGALANTRHVDILHNILLCGSPSTSHADAVNILIRSKATNYITSIALIQFDVIPPEQMYPPSLAMCQRIWKSSMQYHVTLGPGTFTFKTFVYGANVLKIHATQKFTFDSTKCNQMLSRKCISGSLYNYTSKNIHIHIIHDSCWQVQAPDITPLIWYISKQANEREYEEEEEWEEEENKE